MTHILMYTSFYLQNTIFRFQMPGNIFGQTEHTHNDTLHTKIFDLRGPTSKLMISFWVLEVRSGLNVKYSSDQPWEKSHFKQVPSCI